MKKTLQKLFCSIVIVGALFPSRQMSAQCALANYAGISVPSNGGVTTNGISIGTSSNYSPGTYTWMPVLAGGSYGISTCGAGMDTQLSIYDPSSTLIIYNDDSGPLCAGLQASVDNIVPNFTDFISVQVSQYSCLPGGTASINVYFRQNDNLAFTSSAAPLCSGQTLSLSATPVNVGSIPLGYGDAGTFSGTGVSGTVFTAPSVGVPTNFTITYTFGYVAHTQTITVNPLPSVVANVSASAVCIGDMETLTGGGASSYTWDNSVTDGVAFAPAATATYMVTGTDGNGCINTAATTVTVNSLPVVSANASASTVCAGDMETLTGSGANSYIWDNSVTDGVAFAPAATATYIVTGTDGNGCINTATTTVTVNSLPAVSAIASMGTVCQGDMETLTGSGANSYIWDNSVTDGVAFATTATTTYIVTGTDGNGCMNTATTTVTVNSLPSVSANASAAALCMGDMETLTGSGANSYTWDNSVTDGVAFAPAATAIYMVIGTDGNGCMNTFTIMVPVNSLPTIFVNTTAMSICMGDMETLTGGGATSYTWDNSVTDGVAFAPAATATYMVTGTDGNGCINTATTTVTVNSLPIVSANTTANEICFGDMVTLTGGGATTYSWDNGVTDGVAFAPVSATLITYTVMGMDGNGCMNTATVNVNVNPLPTVGANTTANSLCTGGSVTLTGSGATSYSWDKSVTDGVAFAPAATATYMVTGTDGNGCMNTASATVTVNSLPTVTYSETMTMACVNWAAYALAAGSPANGVYSGMGVMGTSFDPAMAGAGTYYVTYTFTDANGCTSADSSAITVDACTGIQNLTNASALTAYPNPNNGEFTITANAEGVYTIVNQLGQTIKSVQLTAANNYTMNLDGISNGIYFITGVNGNKVVRQKIIVTR